MQCEEPLQGMGRCEGIKCNGNMKFRRHRFGFRMQTFLQIGWGYILGIGVCKVLPQQDCPRPRVCVGMCGARPESATLFSYLVR